MTRSDGLVELPPIKVEHDGARAELIVSVNDLAAAKSVGVLAATGWFTEEGVSAIADHALVSIFGEEK